jgi:hypothetical protein
MHANAMRSKQATDARNVAMLVRGGCDLKPFARNMMPNVINRWGLENISGSCIVSDVRASQQSGTIYYPRSTASFERPAEVTRSSGLFGGASRKS